MSGSIVFAALSPHPPIIVPEVGRGQEEMPGLLLTP